MWQVLPRDSAFRVEVRRRYRLSSARLRRLEAETAIMLIDVEPFAEPHGARAVEVVLAQAVFHARIARALAGVARPARDGSVRLRLEHRLAERVVGPRHGQSVRIRVYKGLTAGIIPGVARRLRQRVRHLHGHLSARAPLCRNRTRRHAGAGHVLACDIPEAVVGEVVGHLPLTVPRKQPYAGGTAFRAVPGLVRGADD